MITGNKRSRPIGELGFAMASADLAPPVRPPSSGPRGVYITSGLGGFYYRQRAALARGTQPPPAAEPSARVTQYLSTQAISSASVQDLTDVSQDDFVASLNQWTTRGALQLGAAIAAGLAVAIAAALGARAAVIGQVAGYAAIAWLLARFLEHRRRRFLLMFDLGAEELSRYQLLAAALGDLATSGVLRGVQLIGHHHDWKHHAGATRSLSFEPATLQLIAPPHIVTNLTPWRLSTQGLQLYFFPDRILIRSRGRFASLAYNALELAVHLSNFVWHDALPHDAQIVGQAWRYARRDGGPDRRFQRNRQIPLVRTAYVTIKSETGLEVVVQTTRIAAAEQLVSECRDYGRATGQHRALPPSGRPEIDAALAALGLPTLVMPADLKRVYRELAARNQPDRLGTRELRRFTEERLTEVRTAYRTLRRETAEAAPLDVDAGVAPLDPAPVDAEGTEPVMVAPDRPRRRGLAIEGLAIGSALLAAGAVFAFGRSASAPGPVIHRAPPAVAQPALDPPAPPLPTTAPVLAVPVITPPPATAPAVATQRIAGACALRVGPSNRTHPTAMLAPGSEVTLLDAEDGWRLIRDAAGHEGWTAPRCWQPARKHRAATDPHAGVSPPDSPRGDARQPSAPLEPVAAPASDPPGDPSPRD